MKVLAEINYSDCGLLLPHPAHPYGTHCRRFGRRLLAHQPQGSIKKKRQRSSLLFFGGGGKNFFSSLLFWTRTTLKNTMNSSFSSNYPGAIHPIL